MAKTFNNKKTHSTVTVELYENIPVYGTGVKFSIHYYRINKADVFFYYGCNLKHAKQVVERFTPQMAQQFYNNPVGFDLVLQNWINNNLLYYQFN